MLAGVGRSAALRSQTSPQASEGLVVKATVSATSQQGAGLGPQMA